MPDTKKYLDIDGLTEYHETAGHSADIADGSITTEKLATFAVTSAKLANAAITDDKLADGAVTSYKLGNMVVTWDKISDDAISRIQAASLIAADSQTDQVLTTLNMAHRTLTPAQMLVNNEYTHTTNRLCWIKDTFMEVGAISFYGNLQTQAITLYAKGLHSMAWGVLGVDTSWTIELAGQ